MSLKLNILWYCVFVATVENDFTAHDVNRKNSSKALVPYDIRVRECLSKYQK